MNSKMLFMMLSWMFMIGNNLALSTCTNTYGLNWLSMIMFYLNKSEAARPEISVKMTKIAHSIHARIPQPSTIVLFPYLSAFSNLSSAILKILLLVQFSHDRLSYTCSEPKQPSLPEMNSYKVKPSHMHVTPMIFTKALLFNARRLVVSNCF